jgi:VIT1/CCC1 family predicted Fe2+/Mn2+ transporter
MENKDKKKLISIIITLVIGIALGFFGVMVSVFSDGSTYERIITILIILIIYGVLSLIIGFIRPVKPWGHMAALSLPGVTMLTFYTVKEFNILYAVYIVLILLIAFFGVISGRSFKKKKG